MVDDGLGVRRRPPLRVDYYRVLRVFTNLIGNAIQSSPADSKIAVDATEQGGQWFRFSILDAVRESLTSINSRFSNDTGA